jgi:photosystem II stability/assembly factor-like uncharacterized protein
MKLKIALLFFAALLIQTGNAEAQWVQTSGPYGGTIDPLVANSSFLFAATEGAGVFRSSDNGSTWSPCSSGLLGLSEGYALSASGTSLLAANSYGVFRSTDNGDNWTIVDSQLTSIESFAVAGADIFAHSDSIIFRSTDNGSTWQPVFSDSLGLGLGFANIFCLSSNGTTLLAGTWTGIFRSTDYGASWTTVVPLPGSGIIFGIGMFGNTDVISLENGFGPASIICSMDGGITWTTVGLFGVATAGFAGSGDTIWAGIGDSIVISTDSGKSWTYAGGAIPSVGILCLSYLGSKLFAGTEYTGVFRSSDNGASWLEANEGITNVEIPSLSALGANLFAGTGDVGVFHTTDSGTTWIALDSGLHYNNTFQSVYASPSLLIAGTDGTGVYRSTDNGNSWTQPFLQLFGFAINTFCASGGNLFAGTYGSGVYVSTDDGMIWTSASASNIALSTSTVWALDTIGTNIIGGTTAGAFWSSDGGMNWSQSTSISDTVYALGTNGAIIFAGTSGGVFQSADKGETWSITAFHNAVNALATDQGNLFANSAGVFLSIDSGKNWSSVDTGLTGVDVLTLAVNGDGLYAGTRSGSVWRRPIWQMVSTGNEAVNENTPLQPLSIYPNPVSQEATISFSSDVASSANVSIYNLLGCEVAQLYDGTLDAGNHSFTWDASGTTSGAYICVVRMNGQVSRVPVVVAK